MTERLRWNAGVHVSLDQLRTFGEDGYLVVRGVVAEEFLAAADAEIDGLIATEEPAPGPPERPFWFPPPSRLPACDGALRESGALAIAEQLVAPHRLENAIDHIQIATSLPRWSHIPGGPHIDMHSAGAEEPGSFSLLVGIYLGDESEEGRGNLWVWPGSHHDHARLFNAKGVDALLPTSGHASLDFGIARPVLARRGDVLLSHFLTGHNSSGNQTEHTRRVIYFRLSCEGHRTRWKDTFLRPLTEFQPVENAVDEAPAEPRFVSGIDLNRGFYAEVVRSLLEGVSHSAARIGWGSDVLGFDTQRSTDHGFGPTVQLFVAADQVDGTRQRLETGLPESYRGWPVRYGWDEWPVEHRVDVSTLSEWCISQLGFDATEGVHLVDWLLVPQQKLLELTRGAVFTDFGGSLRRLRAQLAYYPDDVWLWLIACQWRRIAQEEAFVGRTAEVGDELGSQVVAARLARDLMRMWFLFERAYAPYSKWLGSAFAQLPAADELGRCLSETMAARDYPAREAALAEAYEFVARRHNELGITEHVDPTVRLYYGRPFRVLMADRFADACRTALADSPLARLPLVGSVDQFADSTDVLSHTTRARQLRALFD